MFKKKEITSLTSIVDNILKKNAVYPDYMVVFSNWDKIVGNDIALIASPHKVVSQFEKLILILKVQRGFSVEIQHSSYELLNKINHFIGSECFANIKVIQM